MLMLNQNERTECSQSAPDRSYWRSGRCPDLLKLITFAVCLLSCSSEDTHLNYSLNIASCLLCVRFSASKRFGVHICQSLLTSAIYTCVTAKKEGPRDIAKLKMAHTMSCTLFLPNNSKNKFLHHLNRVFITCTNSHTHSWLAVMKRK